MDLQPVAKLVLPSSHPRRMTLGKPQKWVESRLPLGHDITILWEYMGINMGIDRLVDW